MAVCFRYINAVKCVNCEWNMLKVNKFSGGSSVGDLPAAERDLLTSWLPTVDNLNERRVCHFCVTLVRTAEAEGGERGPMGRRVSHTAVCAACGDSIARRRARPVDLQRPVDSYIFMEYLKVPFKDDMKVCNSCTKHGQRALANKQRKSIQEISANPDDTLVTESENLQFQEPNQKPALTQPKPTIKLVRELTVDGYAKVLGEGGGKCAVCDGTAVQRLNLATRQQLLLRRQLYVSSSARVCDKHRIASDWLKIESPPCAFTGAEIADMVFLLKANWAIDFDKLEDLDPFVMNQWIGMTHENFKKAFEKSELKEREEGKFALAVYLAHKHTGECAAVLASLWQRPRAAVEAALQMVAETHKTHPE